jgi:hypothetical protein
MGDDCESPPTGNPSSFISSSSQHQSSSQHPFSPPWEMGHHCGIGCDAALTKKQKFKKNSYTVFAFELIFCKFTAIKQCTLKCTKLILEKKF